MWNKQIENEVLPETLTGEHKDNLILSIRYNHHKQKIMQLVRELKSHKYREGPGGEVLTTRAVEIILEYLDVQDIRKIKCI